MRAHENESESLNSPQVSSSFDRGFNFKISRKPLARYKAAVASFQNSISITERATNGR